MKDNNKKFSTTESLLPLLQQLQHAYANKCRIFWIYTMAHNKGLSIFVKIKKNGHKVNEFSFYWFNDTEILERKYNEICGCLIQV